MKLAVRTNSGIPILKKVPPSGTCRLRFFLVYFPLAELATSLAILVHLREHHGSDTSVAVAVDVLRGASHTPGDGPVCWLLLHTITCAKGTTTSLMRPLGPVSALTSSRFLDWAVAHFDVRQFDCVGHEALQLRDESPLAPCRSSVCPQCGALLGVSPPPTPADLPALLGTPVPWAPGAAI